MREAIEAHAQARGARAKHIGTLIKSLNVALDPVGDRIEKSRNRYNVEALGEFYRFKPTGEMGGMVPVRDVDLKALAENLQVPVDSATAAALATWSLPKIAVRTKRLVSAASRKVGPGLRAALEAAARSLVSAVIREPTIGAANYPLSEVALKEEVAGHVAALWSDRLGGSVPDPLEDELSDELAVTFLAAIGPGLDVAHHLIAEFGFHGLLIDGSRSPAENEPPHLRRAIDGQRNGNGDVFDLREFFRRALANDWSAL